MRFEDIDNEQNGLVRDEEPEDDDTLFGVEFDDDEDEDEDDPADPCNDSTCDPLA